MEFQTNFQSQLKDPKQKRLLVVAVLLLVALGVVVWRMFFSGPGAPLLPDVANLGGATSPASSQAARTNGARENDLKRIKLDTDIIESDAFNELRTYSADIPVQVLEKGNADPFKQRAEMLPLSPTSSSSLNPKL